MNRARVMAVTKAANPATPPSARRRSRRPAPPRASRWRCPRSWPGPAPARRWQGPWLEPGTSRGAAPVVLVPGRDRQERRGASTSPPPGRSARWRSGARAGTSSATSRGAEQRADDRAQAEAGVEARHDRAAEVALDLRALDVHRDVPDTDAHAVEEETDHGHRKWLAQAQAVIVIPMKAVTVPARTIRTVPYDVDACTRRRQRDEGAERRGEEHQAQARVGQVEA